MLIQTLGIVHKRFYFQLLLNKELIAVNQDKLGHQGDRIGIANCSKVCCLRIRVDCKESHCVIERKDSLSSLGKEPH